MAVNNNLAVPQQIPLNYDTLTGRSIVNLLGEWSLSSVVNGSTVSITSGSLSTVPNNTTLVNINPSTAIASYTLTMPANPVDGDVLKIVFGGTIAVGSPVISTTFTLSANTGQVLFGTAPAAIENGGAVLVYQYDVSLTRWVRLQ